VPKGGALPFDKGFEGPMQKLKYHMQCAPPTATTSAQLAFAHKRKQYAFACDEVVGREPDETVHLANGRLSREPHAIDIQRDRPLLKAIAWLICLERVCSIGSMPLLLGACFLDGLLRRRILFQL
jgi:hypothetical protein